MAKKSCDISEYLSTGFILRVAVGGMLLLAGHSKLQGGTAAFVDAVLPLFADTVLPAALVKAFVTAVPTVEVVLGALLVLGLFTDLAVRLAALLFAIYIIALTAQNSPNNAVAMIGNFVYILALSKVLCSGPSKLSLDRLKETGGKKKK